ncbi:hypothetical protein HHK36_005545 [Tetracentron sinense]|uniref:SHSP domain-containing protein n=1 Tax=Tetracentron sinense TaxID=13715 RepID=A0A834ZKU3_TETSI|nr:hypothetical protein HHK36_005545 [Tetracentron sinense]
MSSGKQLQVQSEDQNPQKWRVSLREDVFNSFISQGNPAVQNVFGDGSLFSPLLFGKFFDPSDAFPLWEFESDILLSGLRSSGKSTVDWFETDTDYVLKAELPGVEIYNTQVSVENGKVVAISGQWKQQRESNANDWRNGNWWELGYVRRLELPENADWRTMGANVDRDRLLEIRIPKNYLYSDTPQGNAVVHKDSEFV